MYLNYFGLTERPFSIAPDPHYLYMSARHKEAMAHLTYGLSQGGCFIVLTGEVGTGKTTLCRNLLTDLPDNVDVALILNANINEQELLQTICDELKIDYDRSDSQKQLLDQINAHLLATFADNRHTVLIIDEAQLLSRDVLEKIRLLTNLETTKSKLLQIILIGQPELNEVLSRNDLRQLAQRVTARYHLGALQRSEIDDYVNFRLSVAGCKQPLFSRQALSRLHKLSNGIPRKINVLADHALLSAYSKTQSMVDSKSVKQAAGEVFIETEKRPQSSSRLRPWFATTAILVVLNFGLWWWFQGNEPKVVDAAPNADSSEPVEVATRASEAVLNSNLENAASDKKPLSDAGASAEQGALAEQDDATARDVDDDAKTTLVLSADIEPGTAVVSEEFLDDSSYVDVTEPTPEPPKPTYDPDSEFGAVLETSADVSGRIMAFRNLGQAWDVTLPEQLINAPCDELIKQGVECLSVRDWQQLTRFNRPAILVLSQRDQLHRVILFAIDGQQARLLVGEDVHTVSIDELKARWQDNGVFFWRPETALERDFLQQGDVSAKIPLLRTYLNKALSAANMPVLYNFDSLEFDLDLAQKVFALQTRFNILADGKVGNETYLLMNELVSPQEVPVLQQRNP